MPVQVGSASWSSSERASIGAWPAGGMPSSSSAMPRCPLPLGSDRCHSSPWSRCSAAAMAASTRPWIAAGWSYQWISQLSCAHDSWTAPLDVMRIPPSADATNSTAAQVRRLVSLLPDDGDVPLFVFDAGYDPIALSHDLADVRAEVLTRIRDDRVFYADPPPHPNRKRGTGGRPPRHGRRFKCAD